MRTSRFLKPGHLQPGMFQLVDLLDEWDDDCSDLIDRFRKERDPSEIEFFQSADSLILESGILESGLDDAQPLRRSK